MNAATDNYDLIWQLGDYRYPEQVVSFLKRFEGSFCVFSRSVRQLYSNYEIQRTNSISKSVVTLPNPHAWHDTFFNIPEEAVLPTGMVVSPGELGGSQRWILCYRSEEAGRWKGMDLEKGIEKFRYRYGKDDPFLPVIMNTDLRKSSTKDQPLMHLHRISLKKLELLSELQRNDILKTVTHKISTLAA